MKEFADSNVLFAENKRKFLKWIENAEGKQRNCSL